MKQFIKSLSPTPLNGEPFINGETVTFTNDNGVAFPGCKIIGFLNQIYPNSGTIYLDYDCYWYPTKEQNLTREC
jgi:hypothetical protein